MPPAALRPHDIGVALQLALTPAMPYAPLAAAVGLSLGGAHSAVKRLERARLVRRGERIVNRGALLELLVHGVQYVFPAEPGAETRGVPTAHTAPPLVEEFASAPAVVWPSASGGARGQGLEPLFAGAPRTVGTSPALYELLALVDAMRMGGVREKRRARQILSTRLQNKGLTPRPRKSSHSVAAGSRLRGR